jgi:uncharacterized protein YcbX
MSRRLAPCVTHLYRYPVKGLSPQRLEAVQLTAGDAIPFDRAYAIEGGPGRFDPAEPRYLPKINFLMLMRDERLATLQTRFDEPSQTLVIFRGGKPVVCGDLTTRPGREMIEQFLAAYMNDSLKKGPPRIVSATGHSFSDVAAKCLHIVNLASVRELERTADRRIDPLRFRANVYIDNVPGWDELSWMGKQLIIGGATLTVFHRTQRCAAINVDPVTGARDMAIPAVLLRTWGHSDFGIYAKVTAGGRISRGDCHMVA